MATRSQVLQQQRATSAIVDAARRDLRAFWRSLNLADPIEARDALMDFMPALVREYGNAAGVAAADFYDELRADVATKRRFTAIIAEADDEAVTAATRRLAGSLFDGDTDGMLAGLEAVADKHVKQVGRDTIQRSAAADPANPGWARVPTGATTCAWCLKLASRGFVYESKESAVSRSDGGRYHHACDCTPVPDFTESPALEGYDPDALYEQYRAQKGTS